MCVIGAHEQSSISSQPLKPDPDIRLNVFDKVTNMNRPVGVRQGGGHKDSSLIHDSNLSGAYSEYFVRFPRNGSGLSDLLCFGVSWALFGVSHGFRKLQIST